MPPSQVGAQVLAGPIACGRLEQSFGGDVFDCSSSALMCLSDRADQLRSVHRAGSYHDERGLA